MMLHYLNTYCFCESCKIGNFHACIKVLNGTCQANILDIMPIDRIPVDIHLAVTMQAHLLELRKSCIFTKPNLVIFSKHKSITRLTYALIQPATIFNLAIATVWAHVVVSLQPNFTYFNNTKVKIKLQKNNLCNIVCS